MHKLYHYDSNVRHAKFINNLDTFSHKNAINLFRVC